MLTLTRDPSNTRSSGRAMRRSPTKPGNQKIIYSRDMPYSFCIHTRLTMLSNRENASSVLDEYLENVGGRDKIFEETTKALKTKKRGRPSAGTPAGANKRSRNDNLGSSTPPATADVAKWKPPAGLWDDHIAEIDAAEDEKTGGLIIYLSWRNGKKTSHGTDVVYKRCPQKVML
jgi:hypothetical protein